MREGMQFREDSARVRVQSRRARERERLRWRMAGCCRRRCKTVHAADDDAAFRAARMGRARRRPVARTRCAALSSRVKQTRDQPEPPRTRLATRARALADAGQLDAAASAAHAYLERHPSNADAYYLLGVIADARGEHQRVARSQYRARAVSRSRASRSAHASGRVPSRTRRR